MDYMSEQSRRVIYGSAAQAQQGLDDEFFMREAIALSLENVVSGRGGPFGALVVKEHQVISRGTNLVTTTNDPTAHAEIVAVRGACQILKDFQLSGCDIYSSCEPCPMCLAALYWSRPRRILYAGTHDDAARVGFDDSYIYEQLSLPTTQRGIPMKQLMRDEAQEAFRAWSLKSDKRRY